MGVKQIKLTLRKDASYAKFKEIAKYCSSLAEFDNLSTELESMHSARKSRNLHLKSPSLRKIIDASMQGSSYRSRCVEILNHVSKAQRMLQAAIDRIESHILANFREQLGVNSQADKKTLMKAILQSAYYQLADYERITEMAKNIVEDIDQTQWSLKHTLDALNILYTRESILGQAKK